MSVYIIAEAGINHCGSMEKALQLVNVAKQAGANAVKFQTYVTDRICRKDSQQYATLKACELPYSAFTELQKAAKDLGIDFISTPDDLQDAEFLETLGMPYMKIGSANATEAFLRSIVHLKTPLLVSCGMAADAASLPIAGVACFMHCTSSYPCPSNEANVSRIDGDVITGFSDHTEGATAAALAVARGARFIEKHITLNTKLSGPDHKMSLPPQQFRFYVQTIRLCETILGDGACKIQPGEQETIRLLGDRK